MSDVLDMPKRPPWDYSMSKERVEKNEEMMFQQYIEKIYAEHDRSDLSYFECSLETWRQLWRVLEVSDIVVIVADVRFPVLHFPPALYNYVVHDLNKHVILALNKIDLVNPELVVAWKHYFKSKYDQVSIVCFTSFPKDESERKSHQEKVLRKTKRRKKRGFAVGPQELLEECSKICKDRVELSSWEEKIASQSRGSEDDESPYYDHDNFSDDSEEEDDSHAKSEDILRNESILTLGLVGQPNVGKSSLLNGLVGKKVVSTSRTPGHTKHFQTIFLTPTVRLCDSPGLVFPSLIDKQLQILAGLYPVSQVKEPYTSIGYLAARWPVIQQLQLIHPIDNEALNDEEKRHAAGRKDHPWSAWDVCDAWAEQRGYLTAKAGRNDTYRAANSILRLAVEGKIPFYFYPPGFITNKDKWLQHPETKAISELQEKYSQSKKQEEDNLLQSQSEDEEDDNENETKSDAVVSNNPFALLSNE
ncbi:guanine nucleotide-binding protein-like 1 isoform X2 [Actinia tenebrosa]|uniref:Guanine nucleotide-binding protein-like 1 n=1 Tax=Actinia tenebrosa TaxID=6105 RepID=A0A6P8I5U2_ACTTE|nr:guanine nucleotide-binding protein-like 1 isoform X2 [Actinia tenebrosa]